MNSPYSIILMLLLYIGDDIKTVSFYKSPEHDITECVLEAGALNVLVDAARRESDEEEAERQLLRHPNLRWIDVDDLEDARFDCTTAIMVGVPRE